MPILHPFPYFAGFEPANPYLPSFYAQADDLEQRIMYLCREYCKLVQFTDGLVDNVNAWKELTEQIQIEFEAFKAHGFDDYYLEQVQKWIDEHLRYIYDHTIKQIFFGLDDTGHLVAFVPDGWDDIIFSTPLDYSLPSYGRLVLSYDV